MNEPHKITKDPLIAQRAVTSKRLTALLAAGPTLAAGLVLALMAGDVTIRGGSVVNNPSKLSLIILLVQAGIAAFGFLAHSLAKRSLWIQLGAAAQEQGVPLRSLERSAGAFAMLSTWSLGTAGKAAAVAQLFLTLTFTTWLGAAVLPRVGQVPFYEVQSIKVTGLADVVRSLQTGNCYMPSHNSGLNLGSCTGNWKVGTVAALSSGKINSFGNTYNSGCLSGAAYKTCAQSVIAGLSTLQVVNDGAPFASTSAVLPTYQVDLQCQLQQQEIGTFQIQHSSNESIWITSSNSSFVLHMLGVESLGFPRSVLAQCDTILQSGRLLWNQDSSLLAVSEPRPLPDRADPSVLVQQFAELVTWANTTGVGFSWAPLLSVLMTSRDDGDIAPVAQIMNGLLAGLLNRAYVDSVLTGTESSSIRVTRPGIHFATGAVRWVCVAGAVLVLVSTGAMLLLVHRIPVRIMVDKPSNFVLASTTRLDGARQISLNSEDRRLDTLVAKWREQAAGDSVAQLIVDVTGNQDDYPRLRTGVLYSTGRE